MATVQSTAQSQRVLIRGESGTVLVLWHFFHVRFTNHHVVILRVSGGWRKCIADEALGEGETQKETQEESSCGLGYFKSVATVV